MSYLLAAVASIAALAWVGRGVRKARRRKAMSRLAGGSLERPLEVSSFAEMDGAVEARRCWCGGRLVIEGEGAREEGGRRYRIAHVTCARCKADTRLYFDVTRVYH